MFNFRSGVLLCIFVTVHALPAPLLGTGFFNSGQPGTSKAISSATEPKWLIQSPYPQLGPQDRKAFSSELSPPSSGVSNRQGRQLIPTDRSTGLLAVEHITQYGAQSGTMIANYLLTKSPTPATDADYAKVKVLKDIGELVASGAIRDSTNENYAFIMKGSSAGATGKPLEQVRLSAAQKKAAKPQIKKLACDKVVRVAMAHRILYTGFKTSEILITPSTSPSSPALSTGSTSSSLSGSGSASSSVPIVAVDLLAWNKVQQITEAATGPEVMTYCERLFDSEYEV